MAKVIAEVKAPPQIAPFMPRHAERATKMLNDFTASCSTLDEKLGALAVVLLVARAYGDSLMAQQLNQSPKPEKAN